MAVTIGNLRATWANASSEFVGLGLNVNASSYSTESRLFNIAINDTDILKLHPNGHMVLMGTILANNLSGIGDTSSTATGAYLTANLAFDHANSAFAAANSAKTVLSTDNTTNETFYIPYTNNNSTQLSYSKVAPTKLKFNPSTGTISANGVNVYGHVIATGDVVSAYSDKRLKKDMVIIYNTLDALNDINGYFYYPNELAVEIGAALSTEQKRIGLSAQEVKAWFPEAVRPAAANSEFMTIQYDMIIPILIQAIKELKQEVEILKSAK